MERRKLFLRAELWQVTEASDRVVQNGLAGTTVSSLHKVEHIVKGLGMFLVIVANLSLDYGCFFVFEDLYTRKEGLFRLVFSLFELKGSEFCIIIVLILVCTVTILKTLRSNRISSEPIKRG